LKSSSDGATDRGLDDGDVSLVDSDRTGESEYDGILKDGGVGTLAFFFLSPLRLRLVFFCLNSSSDGATDEGLDGDSE
jgi:hypothetical protein